MLDARSALGPDARFEIAGVSLSEDMGFTLIQVAGEDKAVKKSLGKIPAKVGVAMKQGDTTIFRIAPKQHWVIGPAPAEAQGVYLTPLSSGRTRLVLQGPRGREVLAACVLIDMHAAQFQPGQFVMTGSHHTPVVIHCMADEMFHIYALRTFALNVWEWLCDVAAGLPARPPEPKP